MVKVHKAVLLEHFYRSGTSLCSFCFKYMNAGFAKVRMQFIDSKGVALKEDNLTLAETPESGVC